MVEIFKDEKEEFDAREEDLSFPLIPNGPYKLALTESKIDPNNNQNGENLKLVIEVVDGEFQGRKIYENIVWAHEDSEQALQIGRKKFASLCLAVNVPCPQDTEELHNIPFQGIVGFQKGGDGYDDSNCIKKYIDPNAKDKQKTPTKTKADPKAPAEKGGKKGAKKDDKKPW